NLGVDHAECMTHTFRGTLCVDQLDNTRNRVNIRAFEHALLNLCVGRIDNIFFRRLVIASTHTLRVGRRRKLYNLQLADNASIRRDGAIRAKADRSSLGNRYRTTVSKHWIAVACLEFSVRGKAQVSGARVGCSMRGLDRQESRAIEPDIEIVTRGL